MKPLPAVLLVATMDTRDTRPFVGTRDILMLHSMCNRSAGPVAALLR